MFNQLIFENEFPGFIFRKVVFTGGACNDVHGIVKQISKKIIFFMAILVSNFVKLVQLVAF